MTKYSMPTLQDLRAGVNEYGTKLKSVNLQHPTLEREFLFDQHCAIQQYAEAIIHLSDVGEGFAYPDPAKGLLRSVIELDLIVEYALRCDTIAEVRLRLLKRDLKEMTDRQIELHQQRNWYGDTEAFNAISQKNENICRGIKAMIEHHCIKYNVSEGSHRVGIDIKQAVEELAKETTDPGLSGAYREAYRVYKSLNPDVHLGSVLTFNPSAEHFDNGELVLDLGKRPMHDDEREIIVGLLGSIYMRSINRMISAGALPKDF